MRGHEGGVGWDGSENPLLRPISWVGLCSLSIRVDSLAPIWNLGHLLIPCPESILSTGCFLPGAPTVTGPATGVLLSGDSPGPSGCPGHLHPSSGRLWASCHSLSAPGLCGPPWWEGSSAAKAGAGEEAPRVIQNHPGLVVLPTGVRACPWLGHLSLGRVSLGPGAARA